MRIFDNTNALKKAVVDRRLQALDANAVASPYSVPKATGGLHHYVGVDSTLTDAQIEACLGPLSAADTAAETAERERQAFMLIVKTKYQEAQDAFVALKTRYDKLEAIARAKGWNV